MGQVRASPDYKTLKKKALCRGWNGKEAEEYVKAWKEAYKQSQIETGQKMLCLFIARDFPRAKVARKIARLRDVTALTELCLAINFNEIPNMVALRKRLDEAIQAQKR